jgi:hypothetical protein
VSSPCRDGPDAHGRPVWVNGIDDAGLTGICQALAEILRSSITVESEGGRRLATCMSQPTIVIVAGTAAATIVQMGASGVSGAERITVVLSKIT